MGRLPAGGPLRGAAYRFHTGIGRSVRGRKLRTCVRRGKKESYDGYNRHKSPSPVEASSAVGASLVTRRCRRWPVLLGPAERDDDFAPPLEVLVHVLPE